MQAEVPVAGADRGSAHRSWQAELDLEIALAFGSSRVVDRRHRGPLCIQKPFYPGDGSCHIYVLHPPGGLAGGDCLNLRTRVQENASALITMPASTKFYRVLDGVSSVTNELTVCAGACLQWLPPENILFGGSNVALKTDVHLEAGASFVGWEAVVLGRPLSGDDYQSGTFEQQFNLYVDGKPVLLERAAASAGDDLLSEDWGFGGCNIVASLYLYPGTLAQLELIREQTDASDAPRLGATLVDELLVLRVIGRRLEPVRKVLETAWQAAMPELAGRKVLAPRIWRT